MTHRYNTLALSFALALVLILLGAPAVAQTLTVSGAGVNQFDGGYTAISTADGKNAYNKDSDSSYRIQWSTAENRWGLFQIVGFGTNDYYTNSTDCGVNPPDTGWTSTNASFDPAPTLSGDVCALPVELTSFTARSSGQSVTLAWETASETNNAGFDVERMAGDAWRVEGFVAGHGTTTEAQSYTHTLPGVGPGLHRFRLRQVDYDGAFEYSPEVEVLVETAGDYHLAVSGANPVRSGQATAFSLSVPVAQQVAVEVLDVSGRRVVELYRGVPVAHEPVSLRFEVPASLPSGVYVVRAQGERFVATEKVTVAK